MKRYEHVPQAQEVPGRRRVRRMRRTRLGQKPRFCPSLAGTGRMPGSSAST